MTTSVTQLRPAEWRDAHANNRFPFSDKATLVADTGEFLSDGIFLDAAIHIPGATGRLRLSQITVRAGTVTIAVGDEQQPVRATGTFTQLSDDSHVALYDAYDRAVGTLVSTPELLQTFQAWTEGVRLFTVDATEFAASCCFAMPEVGFRGFLLDDGGVFTGDIFIVGENGIVLTHETYQQQVVDGADLVEQSFESIRVDVVGDPLFRRASCRGDAFPLPRYVRRIVVKHGCHEIVVLPSTGTDLKLQTGRRYVEDPAIRIQSGDGDVQIELLGTPKADMT
jgi:hypothetical protein